MICGRVADRKKMGGHCCEGPSPEVPEGGRSELYLRCWRDFVCWFRRHWPIAQYYGSRERRLGVFQDETARTASR